MKTYVSHINGKDYLYAYDSIFIAQGKTEQKRKSLGRVDTLTGIEIKKRAFSEFIQREEVRLRTTYWKKKIINNKFSRYASIQKIEENRAALVKAKEDMGLANQAMETAFLVDFIYNSNKLEGSKVPRKSVEEQVRQKSTRKNSEVHNTLRAIYYVNQQFRFNAKRIEALHEILLEHEPKKHGLRKEKIIVGDSEVLDWQKIRGALHDLCAWYEEARKIMYPPELAFDFYYRFERIHPFIDGNGRTGRLIMNRILKDHRYHPIIIWTRRSDAHLNAFRKRIEGREQDFYKFMCSQFIKTHEIYIDKIQKALDWEKLSEFFLHPSDYNEL